MEATSKLEFRELKMFYERYIAIARAVGLFKDSPKSIKAMLKAVRTERKNIIKSKSALLDQDRLVVIKKYDELLCTGRDIARAKDASVFGRACVDLDNSIDKAVSEVKELQAKIAESSKEGKTLTEKLQDGAKAIGDKVGAAVEKLKKMINTDTV